MPLRRQSRRRNGNDAALQDGRRTLRRLVARPRQAPGSGGDEPVVRIPQSSTAPEQGAFSPRKVRRAPRAGSPRAPPRSLRTQTEDAPSPRTRKRGKGAGRTKEAATQASGQTVEEDGEFRPDEDGSSSDPETSGSENSEQAAADEAAAVALAQRQAADRARHVAAERKWKNLHVVRWAAEGSELAWDPQALAWKRAHLAYADPRCDRDAAGVAFVREALFSERTGPAPGAVARAAALAWTDAEAAALLLGLRQFAGPNVLEFVMARECRPGRALNRFNATEIVTAAAVYRTALRRRYAMEGREVEAWVEGIPVWPTGQMGVGKENEGEREGGEAGEGEAEEGHRQKEMFV